MPAGRGADLGKMGRGMDRYQARRNLFEKESTFSLENGSLVRASPVGVRQQIALCDVRKVALTYAPTTIVECWICAVHGPHGRIWIPSASFTLLGRAEDRRAAFRAFVEALNQEISAQPSAARVAFVQGSALSAYVALCLLICLGVIAFLLVVGFIGAMASKSLAFSWMVLPAIATFLAARIVWAIWRTNRRRRSFAPGVLPADFAPL